MAVLVDQLTAQPEVPVDASEGGVEGEIGKSGLLQDLAARSLRAGFAFVNVPLGEPPVAMRVQDDEKPRPRRRAANDDATRTRLDPRGRTPLHLEDGELEVSAGVRFDVGQQRPQLDDRERGLAIQG